MFALRTLFAVASAFAFLQLSALAGNELDDYETLFADVVKNYQEAIEAGPDSRIAADFSKKMTRLCELAESIQRVVTRLQIDEVNIKGDTAKLQQIFQARLESKGKGEGKNMSMESTSGRWFPINMIKNNDIKNLRAMGFTTEGGGSYQKALQKKDGFEEFEDLVASYSRSVLEVHDNSSSNEWRLLFEKKLDRMKVLASNIQLKVMRDFPELSKDVNFTKEVNYLDEFYKDLVATYAKLHSEQQKEKNNSGSNSSSSSAKKSNDQNKDTVYDETTGRKKKVTETDRIMKDITYTVKKVQEGIVKLKTLGFSLEGKATREAKDASASDSSKDLPAEDKDIASMTEDELYGSLQRERDRIYKANVDMNGLSPVIQRYYMETLTKAQRNDLAEMIKKYMNRGYKDDQARSSAILELHGRLKSADVSASKAEMAGILKKVRSSKEQMQKDLEKERFDQLNK